MSVVEVGACCGFAGELISFFITFYILVILTPLLLVVTVVLYFTGGKGYLFFLRREPKERNGVFGIVGFGAVASRHSTRKGLLSSSEQLAGVNGFIHSASVSRLPRLVGILGNSVSLVKPHPLLPRCLSLCGDRRTHHRRIHPNVAK